MPSFNKTGVLGPMGAKEHRKPGLTDSLTTGMGFIFGSSICILGQARKKDVVANHLIGGALAGSIWGLKCFMQF
ncbi:hypothetical protein CEXT_647011 [Caerostris extrusa]|uniref:Mitochondrial import inner membrane translocase subunit TIM22 n=1 Tax=Caerostris extrusa TaxID=172846 RepID=A0AAV4T967_CAEEX|nr:hypothetical protein CEXT_647011 [Caerostris extrusa]